MQKNSISDFQKKLLSWYKKSARDLPWRRTKDPYAIWVSEIMLQQTQVKTVIPYYERWLKQLPTIKHLARAPLEEVLNLWAGLGYYRRARMMHQAAQTAVEKFGGKLPETAAELQKIPGIGRYTSGAIASIAFEEKVPVLDGNVIRILTRLNAIKEDVGLPKTLSKLWALAESILPSKNIGDFNQALMELGAMICFPQNPACMLCPVASLCQGTKKNPEQFPVKAKREKMEILETAALILQKKKKLLLQKQPVGGRWGGLWMFPHWKDSESMLRETGLKKEDLSHRITIKHGFTKYRITLKVYENKKPASRTIAGQWTPLTDLAKIALPSPHQKIAKELLKS